MINCEFLKIKDDYDSMYNCDDYTRHYICKIDDEYISGEECSTCIYRKNIEYYITNFTIMRKIKSFLLKIYLRFKK